MNGSGVANGRVFEMLGDPFERVIETDRNVLENYGSAIVERWAQGLRFIIKPGLMAKLDLAV
jgi:hypothetical protein